MRVEPCNHRKRAGIVINSSQADGYKPELPHAASLCCARPECIEKTKRWAAACTNEAAVFIPDADRTARL